MLFFQSPENGGTRTYFHQLTDYFQKRNKKIYLFVDSNDYTGELVAYCHEKNITLQPLPTWFTKSEFRGKFLTWAGLRYLFKNAKYSMFLLWSYMRIFPRLVFVSVGWPFTWFRILLLPGKKLYIQHVMPLHNLDRGNKLLLRTSLLIGKTQFISVSDFCRNNMKHFWLGKYKKLQTVYNYFEIKNHHSQGKSSRTKLRVLALARVEDGKDPFLWIEIAKKISQSRTNVQFVWAGKGSLLEEARLRCKGYDNIQFIGFVEDVDALYAASDIYFEPTKREAHGISVVGAMAWGLPVITTANGGTVESVIDGINGYVVDTSDISGILERFNLLLNIDSLRADMGQEGKKRFQKMYTKGMWEKQMDILIE